MKVLLRIVSVLLLLAAALMIVIIAIVLNDVSGDDTTLKWGPFILYVVGTLLGITLGVWLWRRAGRADSTATTPSPTGP